MPAPGIAWANDVDEIRDQSKYHMMVSLFPYDLNDNIGIPTGANVEITWQSVSWRSWASVDAPA